MTSSIFQKYHNPNTVANLALGRERLALEERINQASIESQDNNLDYQATGAAQTIEDEDIIFAREERRVNFEILQAKARQELAAARAAEIANERLDREAKS
ncbi:hypothetical protein GcM3_029027 [Golovinomyces cichoracearum]|uniref:Uncharacterized protein n=1 Tax=Golovinomyces cichoracearum TaxID=62708 RepID=A0A420J591_9PEZI|nr:hypothetical protein GcM3_029027 [Golovinomyces cichoracearum]